MKRFWRSHPSVFNGIYRKNFLLQKNVLFCESPGASFQDNGFWFQTFAFAKRAMIIDKPYYMNRRDNPNSSVKNMQKIYCINVEYDHIRDVLMEYPDTWERFKGYYTLKRFHNALTTIRRIDVAFRPDYVNRFSKEMKRARDLGETDESLFTPAERDNINLLIDRPALYYKLKVAPLKDGNFADGNSNFKQMRDELNRIKKSKSYRLGRAIMYIPVRLKRLAKRVYRKINKMRRGYKNNG